MDRDYFSVNDYSCDKHWHIGYYKNGLDVECIGFERIENQTWDLFFDDSSDPGLFEATHPHIDMFGAFLFNTTADEAEDKFSQWAENVLLPFRRVNK